MAGDDGLGPYDPTNLVDGFVSGMPRLTAAAEGVLDPAVVAEICEGAWDRHLDFDVRGRPGLEDVEDLGAKVSSWSWSDAIVYTPSFRESFWDARRNEAYAEARRTFPRLKQQGWDDAVNRTFARLCRLWLPVEGTYVRQPAWTVRPILRQYLKWSLLDVARELDRPLIVNGPPTVSIDKVFETGEREVHPIGGYELGEDEMLVESDHWHRAAASLSRQTGAKVREARAGTSRDKVALTHKVAIWTLARGAAEAEVRIGYGEDPLLCCYQRLHEVAVGSWSRYPKASVPTRDVLKRVAAEVTADGWPNAAWFRADDARRADLNKRGRLLHGINDLVRESLASVERAG